MLWADRRRIGSTGSTRRTREDEAAVRKRTVQGPNGQEWVVWRRLGWHPGRETLWDRFRRRLKLPRKWAEYAQGAAEIGSTVGQAGEIPVIGVVLLVLALALLAVAVVILVVLVLVPLLLAVVELAILALVAAGAVGVRLLLRRAWTIEADSSDGQRLSWRVVGWRASRQRRDEIAEIFAAGMVPPLDPPDVPGPPGPPGPPGGVEPVSR
jgi:hypothetical protein